VAESREGAPGTRTATSLRVEGISLAQYAAVKAALAEGFPVSDALEVEGIGPADWSTADPLWKVRLVDEPAVFATYEAELADAEDWLDRNVAPLRDELGAWLAFLDAYAAHPRPPELLKSVWQERLRHNPEEHQGWQRIYQRWLAHFEELKASRASLLLPTTKGNR